MRERRRISFKLNGKAVDLDVNPVDSLADVLRDQLDLTATRVGCNEGVCGACSVLLDGRTVRACMTLAGQIDGEQLETVEGYDASSLRRLLQRAFVEQFAAQCGFCTSGMLAVAAEFLADDTVADHTDEALIRERISSVMCRCTGYRDIVAAVAQAARQRRELTHA